MRDTAPAMFISLTYNQVIAVMTAQQKRYLQNAPQRQDSTACASRRWRKSINGAWRFSVHHRFSLPCAGQAGRSHTARGIDVKLQEGKAAVGS